MLVKTTAIVLNSKKFGDSSKIISAFTRDFGKVSLIAKGSRNPKSKFGSAIEPLSWVELTYYHKSTTELHLLSTADIVKPFTKITTSLEHLSVSLLILESIAYTHSENHPNESLFDYVLQTLELMNSLPDNSFNLFVATQFKLAETLGFWLQFDFMIEELGNSLQRCCFSLDDGSPAIGSSNHKNLFYFSLKNAFIMQKIFKLQLDEVTSIEIDDSSKKEIIRFFSDYFSYHLERKFQYKSYSLIMV